MGSYDDWKTRSPDDDRPPDEFEPPEEDEMACRECDSLRARIAELEGEIAEIAATRKMKLIAPCGIPVQIEVEVDTFLANKFLTKRVNDIDWGEEGVRIKNACAKNYGGAIVTVADLILHGPWQGIGGIGKKSATRIDQVLGEHGLKFSDRWRLRKEMGL